MSPSPASRFLHTALVVVSLAAVMWGALAFGAVYPWAYGPLAVTCGVIGLGALALERRGRPSIVALALALAAAGAGIGLQLVPLPPAVLSSISPRTDAFLRQYDLSYSLASSAGQNPAAALAGTSTGRPLSLAPRKTVLGFGLFAAFALFLLGQSRLFSAVGALAVVRPLVVFGFVLAIIGIAQWTITTGNEHPLIYGFWKPTFGGRSFGPFINPNHFAGWMVMALPLALAAFYEALLRTLPSAAGHWRDRAAILSSPSFGSLLFFALACMVMGLSLFMTRSRSGIAAFAVGTILAGRTVLRRQRSTTAKAVTAATFLVLLLAIAGWAGVDTILGKFAEQDQSLSSVGGRVGAWRDTLTLVRDFPLTGTGLDTYSVAMLFYQTGGHELHFQEAHNDYLQLAAEGGLLIGLPVLCAVAILIRDVRRRFREAPKEGTTYWFRVGAVIGLISIALQSFVEFSLQMPGNAAMFTALAAIALHRSPSLSRAPQRVKPE